MKQVGRKCYHTLGGLFLLGIYYSLGEGRAFALYGLLFVGILLFDLVRLRSPAFNRWALERMGTFLRPEEAGTLSGSPTYILGVALTFLFFDPPIATAAILFLVFGDVSASIVGEAWGRRTFRGKSLEGTAAFLLAGFIAGLAARLAGPGVGVPALAGGVVTAALVEVFTPRRLNDNLTIPLAAAAVMSLLERMAG